VRVSAFILIFSFPSAYGLTEQDVRRSVLTQFPLIQEAILKEKAGAAELEAAKGAFDHKLSFETRNRIEDKYDNQYFQTTLSRATGLGGTELMVGHRQGRGNFPAYDGKYETSGAGEIFAGLVFPLLRNRDTDEARTDLALADLDKKIAETEVLLKKNQYLHKALSLYYKWILEQQKLHIYENLLKLAESRHSMVESKFKAGDIEQLRVEDNLRSIEKRRAELVKVKIDVERVKTELSLYLRSQDGSPILITPLENPEEILLKKEAAPNLASRNPQLRILTLNRKRLERLQRFYDQSQLPNLSLNLLGSKELSANAAYDPQSLQVGVKFDIPLENRKAEGKTVATSYKLQALAKQVAYLDAELTRFSQFSLEASQRSFERWEITNREFKNTQRMADAEKSRWLQGSSDLFVVNLREQDLADVEIRRWTSLYEYHQFLLDQKLYSGSFETEAFSL
jgi:outer membrane protein, heavy metal efflux system